MNTDDTSSVRAARTTSPSLWSSPDFEKQIDTYGSYTNDFFHGKGGGLRPT
jgi:hypothetical protein